MKYKMSVHEFTVQLNMSSFVPNDGEAHPHPCVRDLNAPEGYVLYSFNIHYRNEIKLSASLLPSVGIAIWAKDE